MTKSPNLVSRGQLMPASAVLPGDEVIDDGHPKVVTAVQRARGRKPKIGENLHLITHDGVIKTNTVTAVRVRR